MSSSCNCERPHETTCPYISGDPRIFAAKQCKFASESTHATRVQMMRNADKYIRDDRQFAFVTNRCQPCFAYEDDGTEMPMFNKLTCNGAFCSVDVMNQDGLGQARTNDSGRFNGFNTMFYPINGKPEGRYASAGAFETL